ncbi:MAG: hypothetical protein Q9181_005473 [Wetmoreana brouardii]
MASEAVIQGGSSQNFHIGTAVASSTLTPCSGATGVSAADSTATSHFPFTSLPLEIRNMVYEYFLLRPFHVYRGPSRTTASAAEVDECGSGAVYHLDVPERDDSHYPHESNEDFNGAYDVPNLALFLVNHQMRAEVARIFYGRNIFYLNLGVKPHIHCQKKLWDFVDDLVGINKDDLKLIRHMQIAVRVFDSPGPEPPSVVNRFKWPSRKWEQSSYTDVWRRLQAFADIIQGNHNLQSLVVRIDGFVLAGSPNPVRIQHALEPLASIYGIKNVKIGGVKPDFAFRMLWAMQTAFLTVENLGEAYGKRKAQGRRAKVLYNLRAYHDLRYWFHLDEAEEAEDVVATMQLDEMFDERYRYILNGRRDVVRMGLFGISKLGPDRRKPGPWKNWPLAGILLIRHRHELEDGKGWVYQARAMTIRREGN